MNDDLASPQRFALTAAIFEGALAIVAIALGWLFGMAPLETLHWSWAALGWGLLGVLPPLVLLAYCLRSRRRSIRVLRVFVDRHLTPLFRDLTLVELAAISLLAGLGEEMLFRGIVQAGVAGWIDGPMGIVLGLLVASVIFAFAHALTPAYLVLAGLIGLYLGALWLWTGNLLAPIAAHAGYDFVAMIYLAKIRARRVEIKNAASRE
jgi:hypothetical protein